MLATEARKDWSKVQPSCVWPRKRQPAHDDPGGFFFIARAVPRREHDAQAALKRSGFLAFYPTHKVIRMPARARLSDRQRRTAKPEETIVPLLKGYIFIGRQVHNDVFNQVLNLIRNEQISALSGMVVVGTEPAKVGAGEMRRIVNACSAGKFDGFSAMGARPYKIDDAVRLKSGAFYGFTGNIERLDESGELSLLVEFLGQKCRVVTSIDQVEAA